MNRDFVEMLSALSEAGARLRRGGLVAFPTEKVELMRYIRAYNRTATPIKGTYSDPSTRIALAHTSTVTRH